MIFLLLIFPHSFQQGISNSAHFKDGQSKPRLARTTNLVKWRFEVQRVSQKAQYDLISKYKIASQSIKLQLHIISPTCSHLTLTPIMYKRILQKLWKYAVKISQQLAPKRLLLFFGEPNHSQKRNECIDE